MDSLLVAVLTGAGGVAGTSLWLVRARPEVVLAWWGEGDPDALDHEVTRAALRTLSLALGTIVLLLGFLTGFALSSLSATSAG